MANSTNIPSDAQAINVDVDIDINTIVEALLANERFINSVASKIRKAQTRDARRLGNLFGPWAGS